MKVEFRIGWKHPDSNGECGLGVVVTEKYKDNDKVRLANTSHEIASHIKDGLGNLLCDDLRYVGYIITWKTKTANRRGEGVAEVDFKEKNSCPPEMREYGRKLVRMLRDEEE